MNMREGVVSSQGFQLTMEPKVHLLAKDLNIEITSKKTVRDIKELLEKKKALEEAHVRLDMLEGQVNTLEDQVYQMTTQLRLQDTEGETS